MSFRLNNEKLVTHVYRSVPATDIPLVVRDLPLVYLDRLLRHIAQQADASPYLELNLLWLEALLKTHGATIKRRQGEYTEVTRMVQRAVGRIQREIMNMADGNEFMVDYLLAQPVQKGEMNGIGLLEDINGVNGHVEANGDADSDDAGSWIGFDE